MSAATTTGRTLVVAAVLLGGWTPFAYAAFSGVNGRIAFSCPREGAQGVTHYEGLCTVNPDGSGPVRMDRDAVATTNDPGADSSPAWSPLGDEIAFVRRTTEGSRISVMRSDGSGLREVPYPVAVNAMGELSWAPSGREFAVRVAAERLEDDGVRVVDAITGRSRAVTSGGRRAPIIHPFWSPLGDRLVGISGQDSLCLQPCGSHGFTAKQIYAVPLDGSNERRLTYDDRYDFTRPQLSPDGTRIVTACNYDVCIVDAASGAITVVARGSEDPAPTWSPDGEWIAWSQGPTSDLRIVVARPDGSDSRFVARGHDADWQRVPDMRPAARLTVVSRDFRRRGPSIRARVRCTPDAADHCRGEVFLTARRGGGCGRARVTSSTQVSLAPAEAVTVRMRLRRRYRGLRRACLAAKPRSLARPVRVRLGS